MARPTKYAPDVVERIVKAIEVGATYDLACLYGGISEATLARWRERYADFEAKIKAAEGRAVVRWLGKIEQAASDGNWTAAAWKLERRYPRVYGRTTQEQTGTITHDHKHSGAIKHAHHDLSALTDEEITALIAYHTRRLPAAVEGGGS